MSDRNNRMDACSYGNEKNSDYLRTGSLRTKSVVNRLRLTLIIAIGLGFLISGGSAFGQFTVQPMKMELAVTPGKIVKTVLNVKSFDPNEFYDITMSVAELTQTPDAAWAVIEPNDLKDPNSPFFGFDTSKLSSCSDWISLSPNVFQLDPEQVVPIEVSLRIRRGVRGFFGAAILATTNAMRGVGDVAVVVRFVVPVILEIQDRPMRPVVRATDLGLEFVPGDGQSPSRTKATMEIENTGGTFSRIKPGVRLWSFSGGHWRVITTAEFPETGIIPGASLKLETLVPKNLPKGKYKTAGILYVDGRKTPRIEKEIAFSGDPTATRVAVDAPLDLDPVDVTIDSIPGATRTATLKVFNASDETVNIKTAMGLPYILQSQTLDNVKGEDLNGTSWLKVTPEQFTLRGEGGQQTLRIVSTMPDKSLPYPCYFSILALHASYPDGQQAGYATSNICLRNNTVSADPAAVALKLTVQDLGESKYLVVARFGNFGAVEFVPIRVKTALTMVTGPSAGINRESLFLSGDRTMMLPFETRDFSGELDLSYVPADRYRLGAAIEYAPGKWADKQMSVQVSVEGERRIVQIEGVEEELNELIQINW